jgi:hypothetical protein
MVSFLLDLPPKSYMNYPSPHLEILYHSVALKSVKFFCQCFYKMEDSATTIRNVNEHKLLYFLGTTFGKFTAYGEST